VLFQSRRIAPVQLCFYVRGSSCAATEVDYYLLPAELEQAYLNATPAADSATTVTAVTTTGDATATTSADLNIATTTTTAAVTAADSITTSTTANLTTTTPSPDTPAITSKKPLRSRLRPPWLESYSEQVVLLDWPLLVPQVRRFLCLVYRIT